MKKKIFAAHSSKQKRPKRLQESGNYSKRNEQERLVDLPKVQVYNGRRNHSVNHYAAGQWQRQELEWVDERLRTQLEDMLFHQLGHPQLSRPMAHRRNAENGIQQN